MATPHRDSALTPLQIPGGKTVLIDNRIGSADALSTIIAFAKSGREEGYTVISDHTRDEEPNAEGVPRLHICTLLRPGKHTDLAGVINAMGALAVSHAIEHNSEARTAIRWLGDIHLERRRFSIRKPKRIATVFSHSLLLPSGFLDYMILHAVIDMPPSRFPFRMVDAVASVFTSRPITNADHLTQAFLLDFFASYNGLLKAPDTPPPALAEYRARSLLLDKRIRFRDGKKHRRGRVVDITDKGALVIVSKKGRQFKIESQYALS